VKGSLRAVLFPAAALACLAAAVALQLARDAIYPLRERAAERILYVRSPAAVKRAALEFEALASDIYWIRAIQHYGGDRLASDGRRKYELLQPLLDLTVTLDPFFTIAYRFGAIFLSESPPGGPGRPDQAIALLEKGVAAQPDKWQYVHDIAFVHYWHLHDPATAAQYFVKASTMRDAPNWLQPLAATMVSAHDRQSARLLWQQILKSDQQWLQRSAQRSLMQLDALDQIDHWQAIARNAPVPAGQRLAWIDLVRRRLIPGIPVDPSGVPFQLDPDSRVVTLAPESTLNPLPDLEHPVRHQPQ
jgi:hypothetical protein